MILHQRKGQRVGIICMVRNKNSGEIDRSTENIQEGTELEIVPASGKITATVTSIS